MEIEQEITRVDGIGEIVKNKLNSAGITTVNQLASLSAKELSNIKGIGLASSQKIITAAKTFLEQQKSHSQEEFAPIEQIFQEKNNILSSEQYEEVTPELNTNLPEIDFDKTEIMDDKSSLIANHKNIRYDEINGEKLSKKECSTLQQNIIHIFNKMGYHIINSKSSLFKSILKDLDLIALKVVEINELTGIFLLFPLKISNLRGTLVVSDEIINYNPMNHEFKLSNDLISTLLKSPLDKLKARSKKIFHNVIHGKGLFLLFNKLIRNKAKIKKTKDNTPLFIMAGGKQYKVIVDPLFISISEPAFIEKSIIFPYQRSTNIHIIQYEDAEKLVKFLEEKYILLESCLERNSIMNYENSLTKLHTELMRYSFPFLIYGTSLILIMALQNFFLLSAFTSLGYGVICIYVFILLYSFLRFRSIQKEIRQDYITPHYQRKISLDETDLLIIKDKMTVYTLEQFIYECFGKQCELSILPAIELEKTIQNENSILTYDVPIPNQNKEEAAFKEDQQSEAEFLKKKIISKYSSFLED